MNKGIQTYTATGLTNGTAYTFTVKAVDTAGNGNTGATVTNTPVAPGTLVSDAASQPNIKLKFEGSKDETEKAGVNAAFQELSAFIKNSGLTNHSGVINLGDYIELEGELNVDVYNGVGGFSSSEDLHWAADITEYSQSLGRMNRLIVVGINSFNTVNSNNTPHVVFQFQNSPVTRRMNPPDTNLISEENKTGATNKGGYPDNEMRKYLTPTGVPGSGNFLAGLNNAGVPKAVLWGPARVMSTKGGEATINDLLWLPTEREMYGTLNTGGVYNQSAGEETEQNQAKLAYYNVAFDGHGDMTNATWLLFQKASKTTTPNYPNVGENNSPAYWLASASTYDETKFCMVTENSYPYAFTATDALGVSPAFCVYGGK